MISQTQSDLSHTRALVTHDASREANALMEFLCSIRGRYTLTGQHNYPDTKGNNTQFAALYTGKTPVVFSTDWGHAREGSTDSYLARPGIVQEAIHRHRLGAIITICWHAVPPTADEPVTFMRLPGDKPDALASVQGQLTDQQFRDVLTPGTALHNHWCSQADLIAFYLKKLQEAHIPVLWRPYHEMNGDWFWWGGRTGVYGTAALYRQLFDRFVHHHKLDNLIWVWSVDRPVSPRMQFADYYPGSEYLDILALDVYRNDFNRIYYEDLLSLANGKPVVLGEVGNPPAQEILSSQPQWLFYVVWAGMVRNTTCHEYTRLNSDPHRLNLEDPDYRRMLAPYRITCDLPALDALKQQPDFSGTWILNREKSTIDNHAINNFPYAMEICQEANSLLIKKVCILEYADNQVTETNLTLDGKEQQINIWNFPGTVSAAWSGECTTLTIEAKVKKICEEQDTEFQTTETWMLQEQGKTLVIEHKSHSPWGKRNLMMLFDKYYIALKV